MLTQRNYLTHPITEAEMRQTYFNAFGKEFDSHDRKQLPLPIEIAYLVADKKLKDDISAKISNKTLIAFCGNFNYHFADGNYYSVFQEGCGNYPELISKEDINPKATFIKKSCSVS